MDATALFATLVGLMVAVLSALGYALHRITQQASGLTSDTQQCPGCGLALPVAAPRCPQCGAAWQESAERLPLHRTV